MKKKDYKKIFIEKKLKKVTGFTFSNKALKTYYFNKNNLFIKKYARAISLAKNPSIPEKDILSFALYIYNRRRNGFLPFEEVSGNSKIWRNMNFCQSAIFYHQEFENNKNNEIQKIYKRIRKKTHEKWKKAIEIIDFLRREDRYDQGRIRSNNLQASD